jgi:DnaK suppressor protein
MNHYKGDLNMETNNSALTTLQIQSFKEQLLEQKSNLEKNLNLTTQELNELGASNSGDEADGAAHLKDHQIGNILSQRQTEQLKAVLRSLKRLEDETYGICEMCGEPISYERLQVKIFADYCISCREVVEGEIA